MFYFGWRPVKSAIEKRENYIASQISNAERLNKEADIKMEYVTQQAAIVYAKSNEMMENVTRTYNLKMEEADKKAKEEKEIILKNAHDDAEKIHASMQSQINKEIASNSIMIASELLKRNISNDDNEQFVNDFINNISHNNSNNSTEPNN
ncbi:ATP synthase F0 subunit B [bacterium]|nr:ATP synthase F0 subunit B [bacterium]MBP5783392.1 ATP synthase F0 subunit B [bacterium]